MTSLQKFDYTPDPSHSLARLGRVSDDQLSDLCPVLVGKIRDVAERQSSSRLFIASQNAGRILSLENSFAAVFGGFENLPDDIKQDIAEKSVFLAVSSSTLAQRYLTGTLEPELHAGNEASQAFAKAQVAREEQTTEPVAAESDTAAAVVNGASDGIV